MYLLQLEVTALVLAHLQAHWLLRGDQAWINGLEQSTTSDPSLREMSFKMMERSAEVRPEYFEANFHKLTPVFAGDQLVTMANVYKRLGEFLSLRCRTLSYCFKSIVKSKL